MSKSLTSKAEKSEYFPALTGIRAIAAYLVYIHHCPIFEKPPASLDGWFAVVAGLVNQFYIGVTVFFVLSGFLIAYRYLDRIEFSFLWFLDYFQKRVARIYPLYFLLTILTFVFYKIGCKIQICVYNELQKPLDYVIALLLNVTFLRGFSKTFLFTGVAQGWSLTVEECFYFIAPFLIYILIRKWWVMLVVPIVFLALGYLLIFIFKIYPTLGMFYDDKLMINYTFFGRAAEFVTGMGAAYIFHKFRNKGWYIKAMKSKIVTMIGLVTIFVCVISLYLCREGNMYGTSTYLGSVINNLLLPIGTAAMFLGLLSERTYLRKFLESSVMVVLGKASYAFYLLHAGVVSIIISKVTGGLYWVHFILINIVSIAVFYFIEEPLNNYIRRVPLLGNMNRSKSKKV